LLRLLRFDVPLAPCTSLRAPRSQRKDRLLITIKVKECTGADVRFFAEGRISFKGCGVGGKEYGIELDLLEVGVPTVPPFPQPSLGTCWVYLATHSMYLLVSVCSLVGHRSWQQYARM
jgi:hypothetical protein